MSLPAAPVPVVRAHSLVGDGAVAAYVHELNGDASLHSHDYVELEIVGAGRGHHVTAGGSIPVSAGNVFVLLPGAWHGYTDCDRLVSGFTCIPTSAMSSEASWGARVPLARHLLWERPSAAGGYGVYTTSIPERDARSVIREMSSLRRDTLRSPANHVLHLGRLMTILGIILEATSFESPVRVPHPALVGVLELIENAPELTWSVEVLARIALVDPAHLSRLFRRFVGVPPMTFVARLRVARAEALLRDTAEPVSKIGALVGWPDPAHFTRRFRALSGVTPSEYRRRTSPPGHPESRRTAAR